MNSEKLKVKNEWLSNSIHYSLFTLHLTGAKLRYHKGQSQGKGLLEVRIYTIKKYVKYLTEVSGQPIVTNLLFVMLLYLNMLIICKNQLVKHELV